MKIAFSLINHFFPQVVSTVSFWGDFQNSLILPVLFRILFSWLINASLKFWCLTWNIIFLEGAENKGFWWMTPGTLCFCWNCIGILRGHFASLPRVTVVIPSTNTYSDLQYARHLFRALQWTTTTKIPAHVELS